MRKIDKTLLIAIMLTLTPVISVTAQTADTNTVVETWLLKSCDAGEEEQIKNEIVNQGISLEPTFLEAYNSGPDQELINEVEASAAKSYDRREAMLEQGDTFGLPEKDLEALKSISREDYIAMEKEAFVMRYKSQALSGLGLVGEQQSYELLKGISEDPDSPMQTTAQQALKTIKYEGPETEKTEDTEEAE